MKFIRNYKSYKNYKSLLEANKEGITVNSFVVDDIIGVQIKKFLEKVKENVSVDELVELIKTDLLNSQSPNFIIKPVVDEFSSPGSAAWNNSEDEIKFGDNYIQDFTFLKVANNIFSSEGYFLGTDKAIAESTANSGIKEIKKICDEKFGDNKVPYNIIKYCLVKVRKDISTIYKYVESDEPVGLVEQGDVSTKVPPGCFADETPGKSLPELKKILIDCGGREDWEPISKETPSAKTAELNKKLLLKLKPVADKKRLAFLNFLKKVTVSMTESVKKITSQEIEGFLEKNGLSTGTKFVEGDKVLYLKKDKTIDDWDKLSDKDKENLESEITKEVVAEGKIKSVKEDVIEIEFGGEGKVTTKKKSEIIKKLE